VESDYGGIKFEADFVRLRNLVDAHGSLRGPDGVVPPRRLQSWASRMHN